MSKPRRERLKVDGWIILDKPVGITSTHALSIAKRLYKADKAGHAGTLDPLASGILPLAFGEATKTVPYVMDGEKAYRFTVTWGVETNTDDSDGEMVNSSAERPSEAQILAILPRFMGVIMQMPPQFSALKVQGERAYDLAREGEVVKLEPREVEITALRLVSRDEETATFEAECGKGTYVRALARDFGRLLGCFGHITALRRTRVGPFTEMESVKIDDLRQYGEEGPQSPDLLSVMQPVERGLTSLTAIPIGSHEMQRLKNGQSIILRGRDAPIVLGQAYTTHNGKLIALVEGENGELKPKRTFHL
ncbi:MAG: tRNA pseudouridine(55) synthase TruB [Beijerinckiaceae bacterium]